MEGSRQLTVVSYNLHGFNQGKIPLQSLCSTCDILFVQEHWLAPFDLDKLNAVNPNMICFASTAMDDAVSRDCLVGRPFGGVAIYVNENLAGITKLISLKTRYIISQIKQLLLINVYLPCVSAVGRDNEYIECLAVITNEISELQYDDIILGGDLNVELNDKDVPCRQLHSFVKDLQLNFVDDKISTDDKSTYRVLSTGACSSVDHFAVSRRLYCQVQDVRIADSSDNLSDHCPLILEICVSLSSHPVSLRSTQSNSSDVLSFRWDKGDCNLYYMMTYNYLNEIEVPFFLLDDRIAQMSLSRDCSLHYINSYYRNIVNVLFECSFVCIPRKRRSFF